MHADGRPGVPANMQCGMIDEGAQRRGQQAVDGRRGPRTMDSVISLARWYNTRQGCVGVVFPQDLRTPVGCG